MDLAKNNLDTQISLMSDIIQNDKQIVYHILEKSKELMCILGQRKVDNSEPIETGTVTFTNEQFEKILDIVDILSNESKYDKLGILAESAVPDNNIKRKILESLQKS